MYEEALEEELAYLLGDPAGNSRFSYDWQNAHRQWLAMEIGWNAYLYSFLWNSFYQNKVSGKN